MRIVPALVGEDDCEDIVNLCRDAMVDEEEDAEEKLCW
jgi:hypothetical protein